MATPRELETIVRIAGELDPSTQSAVERAVQKLREMNEAALEAAGASGKLAKQISDQGKDLNAAKKKYADYILAGEESTEQAQELAAEIRRLSGEMHDNERALKNAMDAADRLTESFDDVEDAAEDTGDGFTVMKGTMSNLISDGLQKLVGWCVDAAKSIAGLADSTQEYREDMGKLETAWETAGKSTELATELYKDFYSVLGEEDRSVEAVNHLAKFVDTQKQLDKWTTICTGVWGTFGDSLPIEGLTEAANETVKVGKLTGVLADALNWAGVEEEHFQELLDACGTEQQRTALVTETLNDLYGESAEKYRENNSSIIDARRATSDYNDTLADLGEKVEPVTTKVKEGFGAILEKALELVEGVDMAALGQKIDGAFATFINDILPKIQNGLTWIIDNKDLLVAGITAIGAAFVAFKVVGLIQAVITAMEGMTLAQAALNLVMSLNPIGLIVAAIAGLVAAFVVLWNKSEGFRNFWIGAWEAIKSAASAAGEWIAETWNNMKEGAKNLISGIKQFFVDGFSSLVSIVKGPVNTIVGIVNGAIAAINKIGFDIPDWVPVIGGEKFALNIPQIPLLATGGFTDGVSIAGEAGTEAVISFDPAYRSANLAYWAQAGRMLGATADDAGFALSGSVSGGTTIDMGGVTFAPNIQISGKADKESVVQAIEAEYPEFLDMLERWLYERGLPVYG